MKYLLVVNESRKVFLELLGYLSRGRKGKETITATFKPERQQLLGVSVTPKGLGLVQAGLVPVSLCSSCTGSPALVPVPWRSLTSAEQREG